MSWFDTKGLASIAKTALKEAQKQIDKALDIQDDEVSSIVKDKIQTAPTTPLQSQSGSDHEKLIATAAWGSFSGSFFENPKAGEMVTTPPKSTHSPINETSKRQSITSNSDSVELLGSGSEVTSPSEAVESIEVISTTPTIDLVSSLSCKSPESVEILNKDDGHEDEEDSMSFNTIMGDSINQADMVTVDPVGETTDSCDSAKTLVSRNLTSLDDALLDSQTLLSDSTQSFENVHIPDGSSVLSDDKDLVKIRSGPSSDHNSADDIETTTSSDIEIISNPNGDSSSTNSACRSSPLKCGKKISTTETKTTKKGHFRGPSEVSTQSEDSQSDTDKLLRRISELSEILEAREIRLLELDRQNIALNEKNIELQSFLDAKQMKSDHLDSEEYTQRLSALEKKFQLSIRERDTLREQLKVARDDLQAKIPKDEMQRIVSEKDSMIDELRLEGEKLAKQILQHSNIIKKLRTKEKESDSVLKRNKEQIEDLTEEVERLKKSLAAKDEVERSQIEAVHRLSSEKRKLEKETHAMHSQIEDLSSKLETVQKSFEAAKKELQDGQAMRSELSKKAEALATIEEQKLQAQTQNVEIHTQLEELREKLKIAEAGMTSREQKLRQENADLLRRLESSELRAEELTNEVSMATIPLVRQLQTLQNTLATRTSGWEKQEKELLAKLEQSQIRLKSLENIETTSNQELALLNSKVKNLEEKFSASLLRAEQTSGQLQQLELEFTVKESNYQRRIEDLHSKLTESAQHSGQLKEKLTELERTLEKEKSLRNVAEEKSIQTHTEEEPDQQHATGNTSPTLSVRRNSMADSLSSAAGWQIDDLDCISKTGSVYGFNVNLASMGHTTATNMEYLQATLKQKDGEVSQLQWELSRLQSERNALNNEISNLTLELEQIKERLATHESMEKEFVELRRQYDALLEMYGEKVEETQELELDLQDVKDLYKSQLDELILLKQKLNSVTTAST